MESSFLEDFLKREVDQNQVNALVGTLENALGSSKTTIAPTGNSAGKLISVGQIVSQCASTNSAVPTLSKIIATTTSTLSIVTTSSPSVTIKTNGTNHDIKNVVISAVSGTPSTIISTQPPVRISPLVSRQTLSSPGLPSAAIISNGGSPRVSIAPKSAVPIAPRLGTNIVLTPRQAQILMAQQRFSNPLLRNSLIARMPGTIPVMPRIPGPGGTIAVPPVINTQISGLNVPRAIINMAGAKSIDHRMMMRMPLTTATSLTQIKQTANIIPGQINYRFRAVNPNINSQPPPTPVSVNGVTTPSSNSNNTAANITMMKESVKRLKEFFQNLINLACGPNQPPEIGRMVKELVHNLMQGKVSEEEFIEKLQKTLKSDPQPNLVHFLKKTLPHLRETIKKQQMHQGTTKSQVQSSSVPAASISIATSRIRPNLPPVTAQIPNAIMGQLHPNLPHQLIRKNLTIPEQMLQKHMLQGRIIATSGQVTPGMNTLITGIQQRGASAANVKGSGPKQGVPGHPASSAHKEKQKSTAYYSSASGADDDINDVTCMAGVNLMEESQKILSTGDFMSYQTRSIKDKPILQLDQLKLFAQKIAKQLGMSDVTGEALIAISHAVEQRLRTILERLTACSLHRNNPHKDEIRYESISDVRNQLRVFEEIDEVERKHRESREREILMRVAKSRSRNEDPEQVRLKEKAKQMQLEEEEQNRKRAANRTALEAIGGPRKKRKLDEALESLQNPQTPGSSNSSSASLSTSSNTTGSQNRTRQHRITIRDVNLVLETEKKTTKSMMLYRSLLR